jgi:hypothetical protein
MDLDYRDPNKCNPNTKWKLHETLGIDIVSQLRTDERKDLHNIIEISSDEDDSAINILKAKIHSLDGKSAYQRTRDTRYNKRERPNSFSSRSNSQRTTYTNHHQNDRQKSLKSQGEYNATNGRTKGWAKRTKFEYMPGTICPACNTSNHNVYKTGCRNMAIFCACQNFYDKHSNEELQPIMEQYTAYLKQQMKSKKTSNRRYKNIVKSMTAIQDEEQLASIKKTFYQQHLLDYPEDDQLTQDDFDKMISNDDNSDEDDESSDQN